MLSPILSSVHTADGTAGDGASEAWHPRRGGSGMGGTGLKGQGIFINGIPPNVKRDDKVNFRDVLLPWWILW